MRFFVLLCAAVYCSFSGMALADEYTASTLTPSYLLQKVHAARGTLADGSYHVVNSVASGGIITTEDVRSNGDDVIEVDTSGNYVTASGSYHGKDWHQTENGIVFQESGFRATVDPTVHALDNPDDPKSNVHVLGVTTTAPAQIVLDVNPPGGEHERLYYDASTYLLARTERWGADLHHHISTFTDYRPVFGAMRAFKTTYGDGRPENDTVRTVTLFEKGQFNDADLAIPATRPLFNLITSDPVTLPVQFASDGRIIVRVTINGRGLDFLLDSGSDSLLIDAGVAHQLGLKPYGKSSATIAGDVQFSRTKVDHAVIGSLDVQNAVFSVAPMNESFDGGKLVGLLGADFLGSGVFEIDYQNKQLSYIPRDAFTKMSADAKPIALNLDDNIPVINASLAGANGYFLLDTGAYTSIVYPNFLKRTGTLSAATAAGGEIDSQGVGGSFRSHILQVPNLLVGGARFSSFLALVPEESTFDISDYDGILGRDVLQTFTLFLDYENSHIYMIPHG